MTERNKKTIENIKLLKEKGFSFSYQMIANYMSDKNILRPNGMPYDREGVFNSLKSYYIDVEVEKAVNYMLVALKKNNTRIWKYHRAVGRWPQKDIQKTR